MTEAQKIARAKRQVEVLTGFYIHAGVFAAVLAGLFLINAATGSDWWVQWVAVGWGVGLALHAALVYGGMGDRITNWQMRKIYRMKSQM